MGGKHGESHHEMHGYKGHGGHGEHGEMHEHDPFKHVLMCKENLGLTSQQTAEIKKKALEYKKESIRSHAELKIAHLEMSDLLHSETIDDAKVREKGKLMSDLIAKRINSSVEARLDLMKMLTPEQRTKLAEAKEKRGKWSEHKGEYHHKMHGKMMKKEGSEMKEKAQ